MLYRMEIGDREIYLAQKALTSEGDYIVYEWNDGFYYDEDEDEDEGYLEDAMEEELFPVDFETEEDDEEDMSEEDEEGEFDDEEDGEFDEDEEDEEEEEVRLDIEAILSAGFVPQGGVSTYITNKYTTVYTQAFYRKK